MKLIKKNKIIIVANGESVLQNNYGDLIDRFQVVGRINNYQTDDYQNYIGSKTSIWFNGANHGLHKRK